jgi:hypothetical protein
MAITNKKLGIDIQKTNNKIKNCFSFIFAVPLSVSSQQPSLSPTLRIQLKYGQNYTIKNYKHIDTILLFVIFGRRTKVLLS